MTTKADRCHPVSTGTATSPHALSASGNDPREDHAPWLSGSSYRRVSAPMNNPNATKVVASWIQLIVK